MEIFAAFPDPLAALAFLAFVCTEYALITEIRQRIQAFIHDQIDTAAITSIATIRPAPRHVFLTPETQAAIAAVTGFDCNYCFINKFHYSLMLA
jgi:hypothetical protein